jgi:hypothetical protein
MRVSVFPLRSSLCDPLFAILGLMARVSMLFAGTAYASIRRRDIPAHREWMIRSGYASKAILSQGLIAGGFQSEGERAPSRVNPRSARRGVSRTISAIACHNSGCASHWLGRNPEFV